MSDYENPYKSPETSIVPENPQGAGTALTETMLGYLKEASPWLRFIGILGYIGCGFICLTGIISAIFSSAFLGAIAEEFVPFPAGLLSLFYIAVGALYFFPARFTYNFGTKIRDYQLSSSNNDLELAFRNNKSLWKFNGILAIVCLALIPFLLVISIIFAAVTAAGIIN
jgi:hypothetical protein